MFGVWIYLGQEILEDLGFSVGENALPVPEYEGVQGVGEKYEVATFAGGCFWCMEAAFDKFEGVVATVSGYTGGDEPDPTYRSVSANQTHHKEAVQVVYDPSLVSYEQLLDAYWHAVDPTQADGQFVDIGPQYTSAIYTYSQEQQKAAVKSRIKLQKANPFAAQQSLSAGQTIVTEIKAATTFWPAEKYHQDYYLTHAMRYKFYRSLSGRDLFIQSVWGPQSVYGTAAAH